MGLRTNAIANYLGNGYGIVAALLVIPIYIDLLGEEAYGLVGFFLLAQVWLALLDLGLSQMTTRSAASFGLRDRERFAGLVKTLEWPFMAMFILASAVFTLGGEMIAERWLVTKDLEADTTLTCLSAMGVSIGLRLWMALYKSSLQGLQNQVTLNVVNILGTTLRYPGSLVFLVLMDVGIQEFFFYQAAVNAFELLISAFALYRLLPRALRWIPVFNWLELKSSLPFAFSVAYTSLLTVLIVQVEKLAFSGALSLVDFGFLTLVVTISGGILQMSGPIVQAVLPRLTEHHAASDADSFRKLYLDGAEVMSLILFPITFAVAIFSQPLLLAWTGSLEAADWGENLLGWYIVGNCFMAFSSFTYFLQYVSGRLHLHVRYLTLCAIFQAPILVLLVLRGEVTLVAILWCGFRLADLTLWAPYVHKKFAPGLYLPFVRRCIPSLVICASLLLSARWVLEGMQDWSRGSVLFGLVALAIGAAITSSAASPLGRWYLAKLIKLTV
ncbi:MAG: hypothetical protein ABJ056_08930 [Halioglobus sp.]